MKKILLNLICLANLLCYSNALIAQDVPNPPSGFTATPSTTAYEIHLSWTDNSDNETRFIIYKEWNDEFSNSADYIFPENTTSFVDTEVQPNINYHYSLWSENDFGPSAEVYADAMVTAPTPPVPANFSVTTGPLTSIQVRFVDNSDLETGYQIQHALDPDQPLFESYVIPGATMGDTVTTLVKDYPHNTIVYVKVRAFRVDNGTYIFGPFTQLLYATTDDYPVEPTNFADSVEGDNIRLTWTDNANNESAYIMVRYTGDYNPNIHTPFRLPANTTSYLDTNVTPGVLYNYRLQAIDVYDDVPGQYFFTEGKYVETSAMVPTEPLLAAPSDLHGAAYSPNDILFAYTDNSNNETGFEVHYSSVSADGPFIVQWLHDEDPDYNINLGGLHGLDPSTTVYFKVRAVLITEDLDTLYSDFSNLSIETTLELEVLPAPVAHLATFVTPTSFTANWSAVDNADHYELYVFSINDSSALPGYNGVAVWDTFYPVEGTRPWKRYAYYVKAVDSEQTSSPSNTIRVTSIKNLTLRSVCSDNPTSYRRWKIINNNPVTVDVSWVVNNTSQSGYHAATSGDSYFYTQTVAGNNRITISWLDDEFVQHTSSKTSTWKACESDSAARGLVMFEEVEQEEAIFTVIAYPNRVKEKLHVRVSAVAEGEVLVEVINLQGQSLQKKIGVTNTDVEFDVSNYVSGMYLVRARHATNQASVKVFKE